MAIKYVASFERIKKVEIDRETDQSVWLKGKKDPIRKTNSYECYCNTFEEAKDFLRQKELNDIKNYESSIEYHRDKLKKIEAIEAF